MQPGCHNAEQGSQTENGDGASPDSARKCLLLTIEGSVVPHLLERWRDETTPVINAAAAERLALLAMHSRASAAEHLLADLRGRGATVDDILLDLFPGAARHMGRLWEQDDCSFSEVTIGVMRLERLLDQLSGRTDAPPPLGAPTVMLSVMPGAQHALGLRIVEIYFRRAGWAVATPELADMRQLERCVSGTDFDAIGLSAACDVHNEDLEAAVSCVRCRSHNPDVVILVGGPLVLRAPPDFPARMGADGTARDAALAPAVAAALIAARVSRRRAHA